MGNGGGTGGTTERRRAEVARQIADDAQQVVVDGGGHGEGRRMIINGERDAGQTAEGGARRSTKGRAV